MTTLTFETAGYSNDERLDVDIDICRCGEIEDGIALMLDNEGWWIISFEDLETIYKEAQKIRTK